MLGGINTRMQAKMILKGHREGIAPPGWTTECGTWPESGWPAGSSHTSEWVFP